MKFLIKNIKPKYKSRFKIGTKISDVTKINVGDYIVHEIHGIARYTGIKKIKKNNLYKDYLTLEYRGKDKVYVPVEKIETIKKYSSNSSVIPKLTKLEVQSGQVNYV